MTKRHESLNYPVNVLHSGTASAFFFTGILMVFVFYKLRHLS